MGPPAARTAPGAGETRTIRKDIAAFATAARSDVKLFFLSGKRALDVADMVTNLFFLNPHSTGYIPGTHFGIAQKIDYSLTQRFHFTSCPLSYFRFYRFKAAVDFTISGAYFMYRTVGGRHSVSHIANRTTRIA